MGEVVLLLRSDVVLKTTDSLNSESGEPVPICRADPPRAGLSTALSGKQRKACISSSKKKSRRVSMRRSRLFSLATPRAAPCISREASMRRRSYSSSCLRISSIRLRRRAPERRWLPRFVPPGWPFQLEAVRTLGCGAGDGR